MSFDAFLDATQQERENWANNTAVESVIQAPGERDVIINVGRVGPTAGQSSVTVTFPINRAVRPQGCFMLWNTDIVPATSVTYLKWFDGYCNLNPGEAAISAFRVNADLEDNISVRYSAPTVSTDWQLVGWIRAADDSG